jgi:hypothetical protein
MHQRSLHTLVFLVETPIQSRGGRGDLELTTNFLPSSTASPFSLLSSATCLRRLITASLRRSA